VLRFTTKERGEVTMFSGKDQGRFSGKDGVDVSEICVFELTFTEEKWSLNSVPMSDDLQRRVNLLPRGGPIRWVPNGNFDRRTTRDQEYNNLAAAVQALQYHVVA